MGNNSNTRNILMAVALSIIVLVAWQYFIAQPQIDAARQAELEAQEQAAQSQSILQGADDAGLAQVDAAAPPAQAATRDEALAQTGGRVAIATPALTGSINLRGARLDDLRLNDYHVTTDPESPTVVLLSPANGPEGYFAEFGWLASGVAVPGSATDWTAAEGATLTPSTPLVLTFDNGAGLLFRRTIAVDEQYMFTVTDTVENTGAAPVAITPYGRVLRAGEPSARGSFIHHEGMMGVLGEDGRVAVNYPDLEGEPEKSFQATAGDWLGFADKYWAATLIPGGDGAFVGRFSRRTDGDVRYQTDYQQSAITVAPGATITSSANLFAGAKVVAIVDGYDNALPIDRFELLIDWGWFYFITKPMFQLLHFFQGLVGNFGVAILIVTVLVKLVFFPLANRSYRSMAAMRKVGPQVKAIRDRYKDDRAKQQQAMLEIYKKEKINPVAGCWPILVQIPVFFALYKVLFVTIEMRHAPFFGWIDDLSAPDPTSIFNLFGLLPFDPPTFLLVGVWPIIMGITMWVQMRLNPQAPDRTSQLIFNILPLVFTFMLASFPAGLVIYWAWNNFLSILQQSFIMRRNGVPVDLWGNIRASFRRKPKTPAKT